jgi:hypothetical protein
MAENRNGQNIFNQGLHSRILNNLSHNLGADAISQKAGQKGRHDLNLRPSFYYSVKNK